VAWGGPFVQLFQLKVLSAAQSAQWIQRLPVIRLLPLVRQPAAFRTSHFSPAVAAGDHDHARRDVLDGGEAAFLLRLQDGLVPAVVALAFRNQHAASTHKCNKEPEGVVHLIF
jgi:hypothetical protein